MRSQEINFIFAHNAFEGAIAETGRRLSGIPLSVLPEGIPIISGDIHQPQRVGDYLTYVGSPYTQKYGDNFEPRVLLLDNGIAESIPVPGPQKRLFDISSADEVTPKTFPFEKGDMLKVRFHLRTTDCDHWPGIKKALWQYFGDAAQIVPILEQTHLPQQRSTQSDKNDKQLVREFGEQQKASPDTMVTGYELLTST